MHFVALNSEEPSIPDQRPQHLEQQRYERPVAELQLSQVKPPVSSATMKPTDLFMQARSSNGQAQNMKPIDSFATHQKIDQEVSLKKAPLESTQAPQFHGQEQQQLFANGSEMRDLDSTPQMNHGAHHPYNQMALIVDPPPNTKRINEESSLLDHRSSNYSKEADHYLNQIVTTLAHFRSLGKRSADVAAQLETQLFIEKDNCGQQRALLDLERQAKLMVQEELQSAREVISQLTEKYILLVIYKTTSLLLGSIRFIKKSFNLNEAELRMKMNDGS